MTDMGHPIGPVGNVYDKYGTRNPIARALVQGFVSAITDLYVAERPSAVLDVGAGEGLLAQKLVAAHRPQRYEACDLTLDQVAPNLDPVIEFREASVYELPFADDEFDLVVCCEVMEHLEDPHGGLAELTRVAGRAVLISTPREPLWRMLNMLRLRYVAQLGNTPGHVQHFSRRGLVALARQFLDVAHVRSPVPWTVVMGRPRA